MLLGLVEIVLVPLVGLLFSAPIFAYPVMLIALLAAGTLGFAAVGTLFAAMLVRVRSRDVLLPVLLYPITVPVMIAGVRGTAALFQATPDEPMARFWIGAAGLLGRDLRDAGALDVRAGDDGVEARDRTMRKLTHAFHRTLGRHVAVAPWIINAAPYESTMGLVQKMFYFHFPSAILFLVAAVICGVAQLPVPVPEAAERRCAGRWRRRSSACCSAR